MSITFADGLALPSARQRPIFAEGWTLPSARHSANAGLPGAFLCRVPLGLALGKECLCRVPDKKHPAKHFAPGTAGVTCSAGSLDGSER
jgi:hypothetical protein